jgi:hypothetical protein
VAPITEERAYGQNRIWLGGWGTAMDDYYQKMWEIREARAQALKQQQTNESLNRALSPQGFSGGCFSAIMGVFIFGVMIVLGGIFLYGLAVYMLG